jgi:hypothetical protein
LLVPRLAPFAARYQASARAFAGANFLATPLPSKSASIFRAREAGTRAFKMRFSRPGTTLKRFLSRPLRPSDTRCSTLIGFIGMVFGSRPNFSSTAVFVNLICRIEMSRSWSCRFGNRMNDRSRRRRIRKRKNRYDSLTSSEGSLRTKQHATRRSVARPRIHYVTLGSPHRDAPGGIERGFGSPLGPARSSCVNLVTPPRRGGDAE